MRAYRRIRMNEAVGVDVSKAVLDVAIHGTSKQWSFGNDAKGRRRLVAFLLAHIAYTQRFRQDTPWLPRRRVWAGVSALGALVYAVLWMGGLPPGLRGPVAVYVLAITLMALRLRRPDLFSVPVG